MKDYLVSVIIPTYKRNTYLDRAIVSVIRQTYNNIEIIIVDDNESGSYEQAQVQKIYGKYKKEANIKYVATDGHVGGGKARNIGCAYAKGDFLSFLDDDDVFLSEKVEKQLNFCVENELDMAFQDVIWKNDKEEIVEYRKFDYITDFSNENLLREHLLHNIAPTSIYFIRKEAFQRTNGFGDLRVGQDIYLMFECINRGFKIAYMPGAYVHQYLHKGERVSLGQNKIDGENWWYKEKQQYLSVLNKSERRFFKFRHYMILLFACIRSAFYIKAVKYGLIAFGVSPVLCIEEGFKYFREKIVSRKRGITC